MALHDDGEAPIEDKRMKMNGGGLVLFAVCVAACSSHALDLHVSPTGNDAWSGRRESPNWRKSDGPLATLAGAQQALLKLRASGELKEPVRIVIADGHYEIAEPLQFAADDGGTEESPVSFEAAPGGSPVISGGRAIGAWQQGADGVWQTKLEDVAKRSWFFEQLFVNGRRAVRARSPNTGYFNFVGEAPGNAFGDVKELEFHAFAVAPDHYALLKAIPAEQRDDVLLTVTHAWAVGQCRIKSLHDASQSVLIKGRSRYPFVRFEPDQRWWVENYRAALDAPGEWFLDRSTGTLFYKPLPGEDMTTTEAIAPVADKFVVMKGTRNVTFKGLRFEYANYIYPKDGLHDGQAATDTDGAIDLQDVRGIRITDCEVAHVGRHAIYFRNGCADSAVTHCHLYDLGGGGVRVGEVDKPVAERICRNIAVDDCIIQHGGRLHPSACGVVFTHTRNCSVTHCDIGDLFYTGVSAGWNWGYGESLSRETRVEDNHIHHLGWAYLSDMGGFYGLGTSPGTVIRGNHIHHVASHRYGGWGLYTDEGSTDVLMENNLVHDTWNSGFHQHYGYYNVIRNNIFAFGHTAQIQRSRNETRLCFIYEQNIVVWDPAAPLLDGGEQNWKLNDPPGRGEPRDTAIMRRNLYWPTNGQMPEKLAQKWTWDEWRKMGRDAGTVVANPRFADLAKRDFHFTTNSPIAKIGFKPWDLDAAGVRTDGTTGKKWRERAAKGWEYPNWDKDAKPWPAPPYNIPLQSFESAELWSIGIRNASPETENKGDIVCVSEDAASPIPVAGVTTSKRSLKFQDAPGLSKSYRPVLNVDTRWTQGTLHAGFDAMAQEGADWFFELRSSRSGEYGAGPMISWKKGVLCAALGDKTKLADIPAGEWFRVAITATTGTGSFDLTLTRADGTTREFKAIPCKDSWDSAGHLLWSGLGTTRTAFFVDNLRLACEAR